MSARAIIPCAIYTRKSSDAGLEQDFNSLDAQYEACAAYIASQKAEGWRQTPKRYDDGGVSGGTMERSGLQQLLADIDAGLVRMVVVYKIDRFTRSLADFARLVERMDAAGCSFVSVTQSFNTSTSMGRLTLNVLLSFAQFEREVTAERIRDKIAASKAKGMWMGGLAPLGYDPNHDPTLRELVVNRHEAATVKTLFDLYNRHGCLRHVQDDAARAGIVSKERQFASGRTCGGKPLSRGQIHYLLRNPIYLGKIRHKKAIYNGRHDPIISQKLFDDVQGKLIAASKRHRNTGADHAIANDPDPQMSQTITSMSSKLTDHSWLKGRLFDETGDRLTPTHTVKDATKHGYYVSSRAMLGNKIDKASVWRLPAKQLHRVIASAVASHLLDHAKRLTVGRGNDINLLQTLSKRAEVIANGIVDHEQKCASLVQCVVLLSGQMQITLSLKQLSAELDVLPETINPDSASWSAPFDIRRRGVETRIIAGSIAQEPDQAMIKALARAHNWLDQVIDGTSIATIARQNNVTESYVRTRLRPAYLSSELQQAILDGDQPVELTLDRILRTNLPLDWAEHYKALRL